MRSFCSSRCSKMSSKPKRLPCSSSTLTSKRNYSKTKQKEDKTTRNSLLAAQALCMLCTPVKLNSLAHCSRQWTMLTTTSSTTGLSWFLWKRRKRRLWVCRSSMTRTWRSTLTNAAQCSRRIHKPEVQRQDKALCSYPTPRENSSRVS